MTPCLLRAEEFQAHIIKIGDGKITFRKFDKNNPATTLTGPLVTLPAAADIKIRSSQRNLETGKVEIKDLPDGLKDESFQMIDRLGLAAEIETNEAGTAIKRIQVRLQARLPAPPPIPLTHPAGAVEPDRASLPKGAVARLGALRFSHRGGINAFALSADGRLLAAGGSNIQVIEVKSGRAILELPSSLASRCIALAFSANGKILACYLSSGTVHQVNVQTGATAAEWELPYRPSGIAGPSPVFAFLPEDSQILAGNSGEPLMHVLDAKTGKVIRTIKGTFNGRSVPVLNHDGSLLAMTGDDGAVHLCDLNGAEVRRIVPTKKTTLGSLAFSRDGKTLATCASNLSLWDVASGKMLWDLVPPSRNGARRMANLPVAFSPDGKRVAAGFEAAIVIWDTTTGKEIQQIARSTPRQLAFLADNKTLVLVEKSAFTFLDSTTGEFQNESNGHKGPVQAIAYSHDGKYLATGGDDVRVWDAVTYELVWVAGAPISQVHCLAFSPDSGLLAAGVALGNQGPIHNEILIWEIDSGKQKEVLAESRNPLEMKMALAFSPEGDQLAACSMDGSLRILNVAGGKTIQAFSGLGPLGVSTRFIAFSPDFRWLAVTAATARNGIQLWNIADERLERTLTVLPNRRDGLSFSPNSKTLLSTTSNALLLWDVVTGQQRAKIPMQGAGMGVVAFSADGKWVANGCQSLAGRGAIKSVIRVTNVGRPDLFLEFPGHDDKIQQLCFSPDGKRLASADDGTTTLIWDLTPLIRRSILGR